MRVVEALDEPEHLHARLGPGGGNCGERGGSHSSVAKKALTQRVVVAVPDRTHGGTHARLPAALPKGDRGVLRALVGVVDDGPGTALIQRHVERVEHQLGPQGVWASTTPRCAG